MTDLIEFHHQLIADIQGDADALGLVTVEAFFEKVGDLLTEAGEIDEASRAYFEGTYSRANLRVDGYGGDPRDGDGVLSLILCDFGLADDVRVLNKEHVDRLQQRVYRFVRASLSSDFRDQLEETSAGFGLADLIATTWNRTEKIKLIIATNADVRIRADSDDIESFDDKPVTMSVWDIKRLKQFMEQGQARADLVIDFENEFGGGLPLLPASNGNTALESYLVVIPGEQLAAIYEKWGPRLLEANVRSFLQARGKVNRGIRDTIRNEPHMFFPYNNGLSATADGIELERAESGLRLARANNLQIVNGGQTTASLHAARKTFAEQLKQVHVQMKLTIVPREDSEIVVPKISEYANSQNRVNAADFFSNHPFHIRAEEFSRRILAPAGQDGYRETKWFYERARGQYADERGRRTPAERKRFDAEYPRSRFFTKTDLAKYENTWACLPHVVSRGAQKNFTEFARQIGKRWAREEQSFDEVWFKRAVAKAIIFRATEKLVSGASWYEGDYRANIVTYAIAKVVHDAGQRKQLVDLDTVWRYQGITPELRSALLTAGAEAQEVITHPPDGMRNFGEWSKKEACWQWLAERDLDYGEGFERVLISLERAREEVRDARSKKAVNVSADAQVQVFNLGGPFWSRVRDWGQEKGLLSHREIGVINTCAAIPSKIPSANQCLVAMAALEKLKEEGFSVESPEGRS